MSLWFVTPAWKRFDLSEVCFEQRRRVMATLAENGIEARCIVVADDDNLDIARSKGFDVYEQDNQWLGRKFNDGIEYAAKHGASRIVPIGSDSWIDPAYFLPLPKRDDRTRTGSLYAVVKADRLGEVSVTDTKGVGPYVFSRYQLRPTFRPAQDEITHGVDGSTVKGLKVSIRWKRQDLHPLQYIGFRGDPHISSYDGLMATWGVAEHRDPWERLAQHYPQDLVDGARKALQ